MTFPYYWISLYSYPKGGRCSFFQSPFLTAPVFSLGDTPLHSPLSMGRYVNETRYMIWNVTCMRTRYADLWNIYKKWTNTYQPILATLVDDMTIRKQVEYNKKGERFQYVGLGGGGGLSLVSMVRIGQTWSRLPLRKSVILEDGSSVWLVIVQVATSLSMLHALGASLILHPAVPSLLRLPAPLYYHHG